MREQKLKFAVAACLALAAASVVSLGDTVVGQYERESVNVASGTSAVAGNVLVADDARLVKTGEGTATLNKESLVSPNAPNIDVLEGNLTIGSSGSAQAVAEPTAILNTASLWLATDAAKANFTMVSSNDTSYVDMWRDVRDTDASATNYPYVATPLALGFKSPILKTVGGLRSLYFRGYKSKCTMFVHKANGDSYESGNAKLPVTTAFAVTRIDACWGNMLGNYRDSGHPYHVADHRYGSAYSKRHANMRNPVMRTMRLFDNGESRDCDLDYVELGLRVLEYCHSSQAKGKIDSLFGQGGSANANREGGDYLMELIIFDAELSEADRLAVESYLAAKWGVTTTAANVRVASGATATVATGGLTVGLSGAGTVEATASGAVFTADGEQPFGGSVKLANGVSARIYGPGVPVALEAGDALNVVRADDTTYYGREEATCAKTAAADTVEKTGTGTARITSLPSSVKKLDVKAGRVVLAAPTADALPEAGGHDIYATIPNSGFESSDMSGWTLNGGYKTGRFNKKTSSDTWQCPFAAPEGDWVLCLKRGGSDAVGKPSASTTVGIPVSGRYELTFFGSGRDNYGLGTFHVQFISGTVTNTCDETDCFWVSTGYRHIRVLTPELSAGDWSMRITPNFEIGDATSTFDDFRMKLVTENIGSDGSWRIPNGGFEELDRLTPSDVTYAGLTGQNCSLNYSEWIASNKVSRWTFTQGGAGVSGAPSVGLVDEAMFSKNDYYYASPYLSRWGKKCLGFWSDGGTATSAAFTPPAGTWQIRFKSAFAGNQDGSKFWHNTNLTVAPQWRVVVSVNGAAVLTSTNAVYGYASALYGWNKWKKAVFDGAFAVSGSDTVTVEIAQTHVSGAGYIDNVELVPANLVSNSGFEMGNRGDFGVWTRTASNGSVESYVKYPNEFGYPSDSSFDIAEGDYFMQLQGYTAIEQPLQVPEAGLYRVRFRARTRKAGYNFGAIAIDMVQGTVTNTIMRTYVSTDTFRPYTYFWNAPAAGTYKLVVRGTSADAKNTFVDDISVVKCDDGLASATPDITDDLTLDVASGAEIALDFPGKLRLYGLRLDGRTKSGTFSSATHPDYFTGAGTIEVLPKGTIIIVK